MTSIVEVKVTFAAYDADVMPWLLSMIVTTFELALPILATYLLLWDPSARVAATAMVKALGKPPPGTSMMMGGDTLYVPDLKGTATVMGDSSAYSA